MARKQVKQTNGHHKDKKACSNKKNRLTSQKTRSLHTSSPSAVDVTGTDRGALWERTIELNWVSIWHVTAVTLVLRLWIVTDKHQWWILHPDEVFQSIEVAHSEVYGYGFRPYEYLSAPSGNITTAEKQQIELGMYSLRSFLYPRVFMVVFHVRNWLGIQHKPFVVARFVHTCLSSFLPMAVHKFTLALKCPPTTALLAAILVTFNLHLTVFGCRTLINSFLSPFIFLVLALLLEEINELTNVADDVININNNNNTNNDNVIKMNKSSWQTTGRASVIGLLSGLVVYMRVDSALFLVLVVIVTSLHRMTLTLVPSVCRLLLGAITAAMFGGLDDYLSYGTWFITPWQWLHFNVINNLASRVFGAFETKFYFENIILFDKALLTLTVITSVTAIFVFLTTALRKGIFYRLVFVAVLIFGIYTFQEHKETRFLHNFIVLLLITAAVAVDLLLQLLQHRKVTRIIANIALCFSLVLYAVNLYVTHPVPSVPQSVARWSYWFRSDTNFLNECYDYVGSRDDVTGVFSDSSIHTSGAYSILNKNVPWFVINHYEFHEFDIANRISLTSVNYLGQRQNMTVAVAGKIGNFIALENAPLVLKYLIKQPEYNYLVINADTPWLKRGYTEVFRAGDQKVLRRDGDEWSNQELLKLADTIPLGSNATILEYEGSWLNTLGQPVKAIERLEAALALDANRIRTYQVLQVAYDSLDMKDAVLRTTRRCHKLHGNACDNLAPRVVLHKAYELGL